VIYTVRGAYGRKYKSQKEIQADWDAGKDFTIVSMDRYDGAQINNADVANFPGVTGINVRYKEDRSVCVVKLAKTKD